ncbi:hypothetical protein NB704_003846 [Pantoea ananatis]|jgi:hypothetical protein|nr:hypothetical protein [Pantoea ananatis]
MDEDIYLLLRILLYFVTWSFISPESTAVKILLIEAVFMIVFFQTILIIIITSCGILSLIDN